jgi:hypothetical protein
MSFILDALKKAEAERQRQTGPMLLEVRVSAPRRRIPLWTLIIGALLGINILLLLVFVLRRPAANAVTSAAPAATAPLTSTAPAAAPASAAAAPAAVAPPAAAAATTLPAPFAGGVLSPPGAIGEDRIGENPADYEPALPPVGGSTQRRAADSPAHNEPPSLSDIGGDFPDLRLDLHVYAARAADRYALINMHRVHEGDVLPEGPRVVAIDRDGVELSYRGTEFMLHPQ